jgi:hypothetical protein
MSTGITVACGIERLVFIVKLYQKQRQITSVISIAGHIRQAGGFTLLLFIAVLLLYDRLTGINEARALVVAQKA